LGSLSKDNYFDLQLQPQPEDLASSCFTMTPVSPQSGQALGLHLPSLVAPHLSHLKTAMRPPYYFNGIL
jgi:hypothetical protein